MVIFQKSNAQNSDANLQSGITNFISWITNLDEQVNNIYKTQNKNKLIRQLGYMRFGPRLFGIGKGKTC